MICLLSAGCLPTTNEWEYSLRSNLADTVVGVGCERTCWRTTLRSCGGLTPLLQGQLQQSGATQYKKDSARHLKRGTVMTKETAPLPRVFPRRSALASSLDP